MINVLHLSDLHFGKEHYWKEIPPQLRRFNYKLDGALVKPIEKMGSDYYPEVLIVSGDLTMNGEKKEFAEAVAFLKRLSESKICKNMQNWILVPGNHDFLWFDTHKNPIKKESERKKNYREFLVDIAKKTGHTLIPVGLAHTYVKFHERFQLTWQCVPLLPSKRHILFVGMNSVLVDCERFRGIGFFGLHQMDAVGKLYNHYCKKHGRDNLTTVAVCHHHLLPVAFVTRDYFEPGNGKAPKDPAMRTSVTLDARMVLARLQKINCRLVLHGHQHQPACTLWDDPMLSGGRRICVAGAGSMGAPNSHLGDSNRHHFFLHTLSAFDATVTSIIEDDNQQFTFSEDRKKAIHIGWNPAPTGTDDCAFASYSHELCEQEVRDNKGKDLSSLFFLFLNVVSCKDARTAIKTFAAAAPWNSEIALQAAHDLYGEFDTVVKFRETVDGAGTRFIAKLIAHLRKSRLMTELDSHQDINVYFEYYALEDAAIEQSLPRNVTIIADDEVQAKSQRTTAFIIIKLDRVMEGNILVKEIYERIVKEEEQHDLLEIINGVHWTSNQAAVLELQMSCRQFYLLNKVTRIIEGIIDQRAIDKSTHIAYSHSVWPQESSTF